MLVVAPWGRFWDQNFFAAHLPGLRGVLASPFVRGAVSGVGLITVIAGLGEILTLFIQHWRQRRAPQEPLNR